MRMVSAVTLSLVVAAGIGAACGSKALGRVLSFTADSKVKVTHAQAFYGVVEGKPGEAGYRSGGVAVDCPDLRTGKETLTLTFDTHRDELPSVGEEYATILGIAENEAGDASIVIALDSGFAKPLFEDPGYASFERTFGTAISEAALIESLRGGEVGLPAVQSFLEGLLTSGFLPAVQHGSAQDFRLNGSLAKFSDANHAGDVGVQAVPEPGSLALIATGSLLILWRRRGSSA